MATALSGVRVRLTPPSARRVLRALRWRRALTAFCLSSSGAGGRLSRSAWKREFSNGGKCWKYSRFSSPLLAAVGPEADTPGRSRFLLFFFCLVSLIIGVLPRLFSSVASILKRQTQAPSPCSVSHTSLLQPVLDTCCRRSREHLTLKILCYNVTSLS